MTFSLLQGLRVVELGESVSAPYCTKLLADMGAEVVKIEKPGVGDHAREYGPFLNDQPHHERSGLFLYLNSNKQGITLDLDTPTGREILGELLGRSQVFVHNLHPTEMDRLKIHYDAIKNYNDQLVMASITPFGLTGPYRNYKAYDINLAAAGGICEGLGSPSREPLTFGTPEVGYFAGMAAASSVVIALLAGQGQHIDIAELESMSGIYNGPEALMAVYQWRMTRRTGHHALDFPYPNCILRCKDGYIFVGSPEGRQWRTLLEVMGGPEWAKEDRFRNRTAMNNEYADEVDGYMEEWLLQHTKEELLALALEHRIPLAPVRDFKEVRNDESLSDQFVPIERRDTGQVYCAGPPYRISSQDEFAPSPAPLLGQHNSHVYCEDLGYSKEELVKLYQTGII